MEFMYLNGIRQLEPDLVGKAFYLNERLFKTSIKSPFECCQDFILIEETSVTE